MKLSPRLSQIVDLVKTKRVADIGTDHALVPIYLAQDREMEKLLATDINSGPIAIAKRQIEDAGLSDLIETRKGAGLSCLEPNEVDEIIIAGMGGELMVEILKESFLVAQKAKRIILQPMSKSYELRSFLAEQGFDFLDEVLVEEERHIYEMMAVSYSGIKKEYADLELKFGPLLLKNENDLMMRFLAHKKNKCQKVLDVLSKRAGKRVHEEEQLLSKEFAQIEEAEQWLKHKQS